MKQRLLSPMEYGIWLFDLAVRTNFVVVVEVSGDLSPAVVTKAAGVLQLRHPMLRARIVSDKRKRAFFMPCEHVMPLEVHPLPTSRKLLTRAIEDQQEKRFNTEEGPLCRLTLFTGETECCLAMVLHHSIADGVCGAHLMNALLETADDIMQGRQPETTPLENPGPVESLFEKRYAGFGSLAGALRSMTAMGLAKIFLRRYAFAPFDANVPADKRQQHFILRQLDQAATTRLTQQARQAGVSLHALINAAQLQAVAGEISRAKRPRILQLSLVDLRQRLQPVVSPEVMGLFISSVESAHQVPAGDTPEQTPEQTWNLAREIKQAIVRKIEQGVPFIQWPAMMRLIYRTRLTTRLTAKGVAGLMRQGDLTRPPASIISNIGRLDFPRKRTGFVVNDFYFLMAVSGSGYFASSVNAFDDRLFINFTYASPSIASERAEQMADATCRILQNIAGA